MSITINADDPRTIRAIEIAAEADYWLRGQNQAGDDVYGVPSQSEPGRYYIVTRSSCDCPDFLHAGRQADACKHILAVRLHRELAKAQQHQSRTAVRQRQRGHLTVLSRTEA